jgi:transcriptional regulator with XRE-family HTH domain
LRLQRGLSQRQLAARGISYAYISRIEAGARVPSVKALQHIAGKLDVTVEHLETGKPTALELGVADRGLDFGSLTRHELRGSRTPSAAQRAKLHNGQQRLFLKQGARTRSRNYADGSKSSTANASEGTAAPVPAPPPPDARPVDRAAVTRLS